MSGGACRADGSVHRRADRAPRSGQEVGPSYEQSFQRFSVDAIVLSQNRSLRASEPFRASSLISTEPKPFVSTSQKKQLTAHYTNPSTAPSADACLTRTSERPLQRSAGRFIKCVMCWGSEGIGPVERFSVIEPRRSSCFVQQNRQELRTED